MCLEKITLCRGKRGKSEELASRESFSFLFFFFFFEALNKLNSMRRHAQNPTREVPEIHKFSDICAEVEELQKRKVSVSI